MLTNTELILGPPGTGKTQTLLQILEKEVARVSINKIAFVSFTRKAAREASIRALGRFVGNVELPWVRTLHSLCYKALGLGRGDIFSRHNAVELGKQLGVFIGGVPDPSNVEDVTTLVEAQGKGGLMLFIDNLSRNMVAPLEQVWRERSDSVISWKEQEWFSAEYRKYKKHWKVLDFTDILYKFLLKSVTPPPMDVVIVDEAQDLSLLQWAVVEKLASTATRCYIAGDDDQAIYEWSGADVNYLLNMRATKQRVLSRSYRLPREPYVFANEVISKVQHRYKKDWSPRNEPGKLSCVLGVEECDLSKGNWLVLVRNRYLMEPITDLLGEQGYPFIINGAPKESSPLHYAKEIRWYESLRSGEKVSVECARKVYALLSCGPKGVRRGFKQIPGLPDNAMVNIDQLTQHQGLCTKEPWFDAMVRIPEHDRQYLRKVLRQGESLIPRITLSTIHGIKGGEADNVLLLSDCSNRTMLTSEKNPDSEHRVFYVGATRCRETLTIVAPTGPCAYHLPWKLSGNGREIR